VPVRRADHIAAAGTTLVPPPHADCYSVLGSKMERFDPMSKTCLSLLLNNFKKATILKEEKRGIMRAACLLSLGELGLGLISWLSRAAQALETTPGDIIDMVFFENTKASIINILNFTEQQKPTEVTWPWSRLFEEGAFINLSLARNKYLTFIFVGIVAGGDPEADIWKIPQLLRFSSEPSMNEAKQYVAAMFMMRKEQNLSKAYGVKAKEIGGYLLNKMANDAYDPEDPPAGTYSGVPEIRKKGQTMFF